MISLSSHRADSNSWPLCYLCSSPVGAWPPWRAWPAGAGSAPHSKGNGVWTHTSQPSVEHLLPSGPPSVPGESRAPGPRSLVPGPTCPCLNQDSGRPGGGHWFWAQNFRVKGPVPPAPLHPGIMVHSLHGLLVPRCVSGTCPSSPTPCHQSSPSCGSSMARRWRLRTSASPTAL